MIWCLYVFPALVTTMPSSLCKKKIVYMALKSPKWRFIYFNYKIEADDGGVLLPYHSFSWSLDTYLSICGPPYEFIRFTLVLPLEKKLHINFPDMQTIIFPSYRAPRAFNLFFRFFHTYILSRVKCERTGTIHLGDMPIHRNSVFWWLLTDILIYKPIW